MKTTIMLTVCLTLMVLIFNGCDADELTGLDPTPTPSGTQATATPTTGPGTPTVPPGTATPTVLPGTATPTPTRTPVPTPTPKPGGRYFQGACFNTGMQQESGYIAFNVYDDGQISGEIYLEFLCLSSEPPYEYVAGFDTEFIATLQGDTFTWQWESPSPAYTQRISLSGTVDESAATGTWTYYFNLNSHGTVATCEGEGTWSANETTVPTRK